MEAATLNVRRKHPTEGEFEIVNHVPGTTYVTVRFLAGTRRLDTAPMELKYIADHCPLVQTTKPAAAKSPLVGAFNTPPTAFAPGQIWLVKNATDYFPAGTMVT